VSAIASEPPSPRPDPKKDPSQKPPTLAARPEEIPFVLTALPQWIRWKWLWNAARGYWTKIPVSARSARNASTTDSNTWGESGEVISRLGSDEVDGIGLIFAAADPFCGIDLDKCRNPETGSITEEALDLIALLDGYTELSVTGTGVHVIVRASLGSLSGRKAGLVEVYDRGRYFTMTGRRLNTRGEVL
jgi:primase-polymerase (primpol)-like protein